MRQIGDVSGGGYGSVEDLVVMYPFWGWGLYLFLFVSLATKFNVFFFFRQNSVSRLILETGILFSLL